MLRPRHGRSDRYWNLDRVVIYLERPVHLAQNAAGDNLNVANPRDVLDQDSKLVAAQTGRGVLRAQRAAQTPGKLHQQLIASGMPQGVVDVLESVQVEKEDGAALGPPPRSAGQRQAHPVNEECAIGQSSERVVHGIVLQFGLNQLAVADVAVAEDEADICSVDQQRRRQQGHIHQFAVLVHAHRLEGCRPLLVHSLFQQRLLVQACLGHNQLAQIAATGLLGAVSEHAA